MEITRPAFEVALDVFLHSRLITKRHRYEDVVAPPPEADVSERHRTKESESPMADVLTVVAKIRRGEGQGRRAGRAAQGTGRRRPARRSRAASIYRPHRSTKDPDLFIFYEQYKDDAAFDLHRKAPHLAAYRERREKEGLTEGAAEVEIYRSITD